MAALSTSKPPELKVARILASTRAEGPGLRGALWVAGCSLRCQGCFNPHLFEASEGTSRSVDDVLTELLADPRIEGVTFLGGEPFDQAEPLAHVGRKVREAGRTVMVFTGYRLEHLRAGRVRGAHELLQQTDLLVDGPFLRARVDVERPWIGSTNQRLIELGNQAAPNALGPDRLEVRVGPNGVVGLNGWATSEQLARLQDLIEFENL